MGRTYLDHPAQGDDLRTRRPDTAEPEGRRDRPVEVPGPHGTPLTLETLPPPDTVRWVVRRKAEVLAAIRGGLLTAAEACARYRLSPEELELWQASMDRAGVPGLRVTRIQLYRDVDQRVPRVQQPVAGSRDGSRTSLHGRR